MLNMKTALAADIGILEAGITALLGYAVVFFGLALLMAVVMGLGKVMTAKTAKPAAQAAPAAPTAPAAPVPADDDDGEAPIPSAEKRSRRPGSRVGLMFEQLSFDDAD